VITIPPQNEKADRAFARSAPLHLTQWLNLCFNPHPRGRSKPSRPYFPKKIYCHSRQSISWAILYLETIFSGKKPIASHYFIGYIFVTELTTVDSMTEEEAMNKFILHLINSSLGIEYWYAGVGLTTRRHPWDECELSFSTRAWLHIAVDTSEQAQKVARRLFERGCGESPMHTVSSSATYVFLYASSHQSLN
jgi:hypothetical protein